MSQSTDLVTGGSVFHSRRDVAAAFPLHSTRTVSGATQPSVQRQGRWIAGGKRQGHEAKW